MPSIEYLEPFIPKGDPIPDGDVRLYIGETGYLLKVSSTALSLASPVFKEKLVTRPTVSATPGPLFGELSLPHDNRNAMIWLCWFLHHRPVSEDKLPLALVGHIALLAHKYKCTVALKFWSLHTLRHWSLPSNPEVSPYEKLWIAYALDNHEVFYAVSRGCVYRLPRGSKPAIDIYSSLGPGMALLPDRLHNSIAKSKASLRGFLQSSIDKIVQPYLDGRKAACLSGARPCYRGPMTNWHFQEMERLGVWPIADYVRKQGICACVDVLYDGYTNWDGQVCKCMMGVDFRKALDKTLEDTYERSKRLGVCLGCLKAPTSPVGLQDCRASTRSQCVKAKD